MLFTESLGMKKRGRAMTRYFFDVVEQGHSAYDFHGALFSAPQEAYRWAELLAIDLEVGSSEQELVGGRVGVRSVDGSELFSVPIGDAEIACV